MTEREALLRAVCDNPDDDVPRLVFADWLDEHGEPERAEFIRVQIEREVTPANAGLERRERELYAANGKKWAEPFRAFNLAHEAFQPLDSLTYRRGFAEGVVIDDESDTFAERAADLFRLAPVRRIEFCHKWTHAKLATVPELLRLREISIDRAGFETPELETLFASPYLRNLYRLELRGDDDNGHLETDGIQALATSNGFPSLKALDISGNWCGWMYSDQERWVDELLAAKFLPQLAWINLSGTWMTHAGVDAIVGSARWNSLRTIDLSNNTIGEQSLRALANWPLIDRLESVTLTRYEDRHYEDDAPRPETWAELANRFGSRLVVSS